MVISKKHLRRIILPLLLVVLFVFQIKKRNTQIALLDEEWQSILAANSDYAKLLSQRSIYRDSVYKIYIAQIKGKNEIIFLKRGALSDMQQESRFFVHVYPAQSKDLTGKANHNPLNFDSNFKSFSYNGQVYNAAHTVLPDYGIEKLNLGQYGFRGNNAINYSIKNLITAQEIAKVLKENKESMDIFEFVEETF